MSIHHEEGAVIERRVPGPSLYYLSAAPSAAPAAWVGLVHGYSEHCVRYTHVMDAWATLGVASVAIDLRGHGRAQGPRGHFDRFDDVMDDVGELERLVAARARGAPMFLFGHSFGGLTSIASILRSSGPWRGLVLSAPYLGLALEVSAAKRVAGRLASRLAPTFSLPSGIASTDVTHDEARIRERDGDPLTFHHATARSYRESVKMHASVLSRASLFRLPLGIFVGGDDKIVSTEATRAFFSAAASTDKTWDEYPGLYHEILNEREWRPIAQKMASWMLERAR